MPMCGRLSHSAPLTVPSRYGQPLADDLLVGHTDRDMLMNHLPDVILFYKDQAHPNRKLGAVGKPEPRTVCDPAGIALAKGLRVARETADPTHLAHLGLEDLSDSVIAGPPLVRVAADNQYTILLREMAVIKRRVALAHCLVGTQHQFFEFR